MMLIMTTFEKQIKSNTDNILPKTRSQWIYRNSNVNYETSLQNITSKLQNGLIYQGIHSKSGIIHTISGIPDINLNYLTFKFKATDQYAIGDTFSINNISYVVRSNSVGFMTNSIVECNLDKINKIVYILNKQPNEPPYNPIDLPEFTYTGQYETIDDGNLGWRIKFLSSGTFTFTFPKELKIDVFLVGGGSNGSNGGRGYGGAGGNTTTKTITIAKKSYKITVGASGGNSGCFDITAAAGNNYNSTGSGGGASGYETQLSAMNGQGTSTREFGEARATLYSGGGGGGGYYFNNTGQNLSCSGSDGGSDGGAGFSIRSGGQNGGKGGAGGGGNGGTSTSNGSNATFYGGGGGAGGRYVPRGSAGSTYTGGKGFQGIVIIRNAR